MQTKTFNGSTEYKKSFNYYYVFLYLFLTWYGFILADSREEISSKSHSVNSKVVTLHVFKHVFLQVLLHISKENYARLSSTWLRPLLHYTNTNMLLFTKQWPGTHWTMKTMDDWVEHTCVHVCVCIHRLKVTPQLGSSRVQHNTRMLFLRTLKTWLGERCVCVQIDTHTHTLLLSAPSLPEVWTWI